MRSLLLLLPLVACASAPAAGPAASDAQTEAVAERSTATTRPARIAGASDGSAPASERSASAPATSASSPDSAALASAPAARGDASTSSDTPEGDATAADGIAMAPPVDPTDDAATSRAPVDGASSPRAAPDACLDQPVPGMACFAAGSSVRGGDAPHTCDQGEVLGRRTHHTPAATVELSMFYLDTHEVSHGDYQACVAAGRCAARRPNYLDFRRDDIPMTGLTWHEADAYCRAMGKRLPTEAEFERAARLGAAPHPWGDAPADCARAVIQDASGRACGNKMRGSAPEKGRPLPSGSRPAFQGVHDLIGNVEEWVDDWYVPFADCGEACLGRDPRGPCAGQPTCDHSTKKVVKGGSWYWGPACATATNRRPHPPSNQPYHHFGFRCAATAAMARALLQPQDPS